MAQLRTDVSNAAVRATAALTAAPTAAPAGGTGATEGAYDTSTNRNLAITAINTLITRVGEIETLLVANGLATSA
jgi:hypothetical protein